MKSQVKSVTNRGPSRESRNLAVRRSKFILKVRLETNSILKKGITIKKLAFFKKNCKNKI